jgi:hypothetical protein
MSTSFTEQIRVNDIAASNAELGSEVFAMLPELMASRRRDPQDDLISGPHPEIEDDGERRMLTDEEILAFVRSSPLPAPRPWRTPRLRRSDPRPIPGSANSSSPTRRSSRTVEELLRFEAPSPIQGRWCPRRGTTRHGHTPRIHHGVAQRERRSRRATLPRPRSLRRTPGHRPPPRLWVRRHFVHRRGAEAVRRRVAHRGDATAVPRGTSPTTGSSGAHTSTVRGFTSVPMLPS